MAGYSDSAFFVRMYILAVTANCVSESPPISLDFLDNIPNLRDAARWVVFFQYEAAERCPPHDAKNGHMLNISRPPLIQLLEEDKDRFRPAKPSNLT